MNRKKIAKEFGKCSHGQYLAARHVDLECNIHWKKAKIFYLHTTDHQRPSL